nr:uncharacterized protein, mitochondrial [Quercus suber]
MPPSEIVDSRIARKINLSSPEGLGASCNCQSCISVSSKNIKVYMLRLRNKHYGTIKFFDISFDDYSLEENQGLDYKTVWSRQC